VKIMGSITSVSAVREPSIASRHGIAAGDILCKFGSSGLILGTLADLRGNEKDAEDPLYIEVLWLVTHYFPISIFKKQSPVNYDTSKPKTPLNNKTPQKLHSTPKIQHQATTLQSIAPKHPSNQR